jgi:hypothetical protein
MTVVRVEIVVPNARLMLPKQSEQQSQFEVPGDENEHVADNVGRGDRGEWLGCQHAGRRVQFF